eukprot:Tamp_16739.p1 GENE.Tamp_16739~~Tamp_16739.p1  ORF type:complete len:446 (+),score=97.56 Tamp_16739:138-1340(+)
MVADPSRERRQQAALWGDWGAKETLRKVELDGARYPRAVCNDGSRGAYYVHHNPESTTWLVFLQGTGWCWDKASCEQRALESPHTYHSSQQMAATRETGGIFSPDAARSPFATANKVYVPSCSSDAFLGDVGADENEVGWHFRGQELLRATLSDLQQSSESGRALAAGDTLYWAGCSSGARGALFTYEYVPDMLPEGVSLYGIFDSPLWLNVKPLNPRQTPLELQIQSVLSLTRADARLGGACQDAFPDAADHWKCLMAEYRAALIQQPYLLIASQYDSALLKKNLGKHNLLPFPGMWSDFYEPPYNNWQLNYADMLRSRTVRVLAEVKDKSPSAIFSTACYGHCLSEEDSLFNREVSWGTGAQDSVTLKEFVTNWVHDGHAGTDEAVADCVGFNCGCPS